MNFYTFTSGDESLAVLCIGITLLYPIAIMILKLIESKAYERTIEQTMSMFERLYIFAFIEFIN